MTYNHAILGESLELCRQAAEWGKNEFSELSKNKTSNLNEIEHKRNYKNEQAKIKVMSAIKQIK